jgi:hypothetical protein
MNRDAVLVALSDVRHGDRVFCVFDTSSDSVLTGELEVADGNERIAVSQRRLPSEEFVAAGRSMVALVVGHGLDGSTPGAGLVAVAELALRGDDLAVGQSEIVVGLVVTVAQQPLDFAVVETGSHDRADHQLRTADHFDSVGRGQDHFLGVAEGSDFVFPRWELSWGCKTTISPTKRPSRVSYRC